MIRRVLFALSAVTCAPALAHVISMSTGQATVLGNRVEYILRMPDYEIGAVTNPADVLFAHIQFRSGSETGSLTGKECHHDQPHSVWICAANYVFSAPVERLGVECSFDEVTVANHIHMLHAERDGKSDRAILDSSFPSATLAFHPPTAFEAALSQGIAGAFRIATSAALVTLLFALALAAGPILSMALGGGLFVAAQSLAAHFVWIVPPRFAESVAALGLVWLAVEVIFSPAAKPRWAFTSTFALLFGSFSGLYFSAFLRDSGYSPAFVLTGAALASLGILALSAAALAILTRFRLRIVLAGALAATGCAWFAVRLIAR